MSVSIGPAMTACTLTPCPADERAQRLRERERGRLRDRVGREDRHGGEAGDGDDVDDASPAPREQRQEGLDHAPGAEEIDREVLFERGTIAQLIGQRDAGVVEQDVERSDLLRSR